MSHELVVALAALAVVALAAFAQSVTGFGFALVAIPLLSIAIGPEEAVVAVTSIAGVLAGGAAWRHRSDIDRPAALPYIWTGLVGMCFGILVLVTVSSRVLTLLVGAAVLIAVVVLSLNIRLNGRPAQLAAGLTGGALLTSIGMNGPAIVIGLDGSKLPPPRFRATIQLIFFVQDIVAIAIFAAVGLINANVLLLVAIGSVGLPCGWALGTLVFERLTAAQFRAGMLTMLTLSAVTALVSAL